MEEINKLINQQKEIEKWQNTFCFITVAILNGVLIIHINISNAFVNVMYCTPTFFFLFNSWNPIQECGSLQKYKESLWILFLVFDSK